MHSEQGTLMPQLLLKPTQQPRPGLCSKAGGCQQGQVRRPCRNKLSGEAALGLPQPQRCLSG